ncbi:MAG: helix-turn-helix domain-containing protein [Clostridiales bacterium]|nr:helix-turn-helix domain-containing protein [Clostridiales bacterium]
MDDKVRSTIRMIDEMGRGVSLEELLKTSKPMKSIAQLILPHLGDMSYETLGVRAGTSRANVYKLMDGRSHPEQDVLLRIAFTLGMDVEETQALLKSAHRSQLTSSIPRDVCILFGLINHLTLDEMDQLLKEKGMKLLWPYDM